MARAIKIDPNLRACSLEPLGVLCDLVPAAAAASARKPSSAIWSCPGTATRRVATWIAELQGSTRRLQSKPQTAGGFTMTLAYVAQVLSRARCCPHSPSRRRPCRRLRSVKIGGAASRDQRTGRRLRALQRTRRRHQRRRVLPASSSCHPLEGAPVDGKPAPRGSQFKDRRSLPRSWKARRSRATANCRRCFTSCRGRRPISAIIGRPANSLIDEVLAPVDRDVFKRQIEYFATLNTGPQRTGTNAARCAAD